MGFSAELLQWFVWREVFCGQGMLFCVLKLGSGDTTMVVDVEGKSFWSSANKRQKAKTSAMSTFSPVGSLSSNGLRMRVLVYSTGIAWNELIRGYASVVLTSSSFHPSTHTHTRTHARTHAHTHTHSLSLSHPI